MFFTQLGKKQLGEFFRKREPYMLHDPEYINRRIIEKGTEDQKRKAWQTLILTEQVRARRNLAGALHTLSAVADKLHRTIFDAKNSESLPGSVVRSKGGRNVTEAYDYSGDTYNYTDSIQN
jgi:Zn-dependent metalloprotease